MRRMVGPHREVAWQLLDLFAVTISRPHQTGILRRCETLHWDDGLGAQEPQLEGWSAWRLGLPNVAAVPRF